MINPFCLFLGARRDQNMARDSPTVDCEFELLVEAETMCQIAGETAKKLRKIMNNTNIRHNSSQGKADENEEDN